MGFTTNLFGVIFVMTEGLAHDCTPGAMRKVYFLLFVDVLQLLRIMTTPMYGWALDTQQIMNYTDLVWVFTWLSGKVPVVPRYTFFIVGVILVSIAVADTWYVTHLFQQGGIQKLWPVKLLRFIVATVVTVFFNSLVKWLMVPLECLIDPDSQDTMSIYIHGPGSPCTPWIWPEVVMSVPAALLTVTYIAFALTTTYLAFEINPLSRQPRALFTGRVEVEFLLLKVMAGILVYFVVYVTAVTITSLLLLGSIWVTRKHVMTLPFHNQTTNKVRGGIHGLVTWHAFSCFIVSIVKVSTTQEPAWNQTLQLFLIGALPFQFWTGFFLTQLREGSLTKTVDFLRADWEAAKAKEAKFQDVHTSQPYAHAIQLDDGGSSSQTQSTDKHRSYGAPGSTIGATLEALHAPGSAPFAMGSVAPGSAAKGSQAAARTTPFPKKSVFDKFFDTSRSLRNDQGEEWQRCLRFPSSLRAVTVTRALLYRREVEDIDFIEFVIQKALQEHPESKKVQMLNLLLLRFVNRSWAEALTLEKMLKLHSRELPKDHQYILHVVERKSTQDAAGTSKMGSNGAVSALSLMEFEVGMEKARKAHVRCITFVRGFWKAARKTRLLTAEGLEEWGEAMLETLDGHDKALAAAKQEYGTLNKQEYGNLLDKYPTSVTLQRSYSYFCDTVLNDHKLADKHMREARSLDEDDVSDEVVALSDNSGSSTGSEVCSVRSRVQKLVDSSTDHIMAQEVREVKILIRRVRIAVLFLVCLATSGWAVTDFYLFSKVAVKEQLDKTGQFRSATISSAFLTRTQMITAFEGNAEKFKDVQATIARDMAKVRASHLENYDAVSTGTVRQFYEAKDKKMWTPGRSRWVLEENDYWEHTNEVTRRVQRAAATSMEEYAEGNWDISHGSDSKTRVAFLHVNMNRFLIPIFDQMVKVYEEEVVSFGALTTLVLWSNAAINSLVVIFIAILVLRALTYVIHTMHYTYIAGLMALQLPLNIAVEFDNYYREMETEMNQALEEMEAPDLAASRARDEEEENNLQPPTGFLQIEAAEKAGRVEAEVGGVFSPLADSFGGARTSPEQGSATKTLLSALTEDNMKAFASEPNHVPIRTFSGGLRSSSPKIVPSSSPMIDPLSSPKIVLSGNSFLAPLELSGEQLAPMETLDSDDEADGEDEKPVFAIMGTDVGWKDEHRPAPLFNVGIPHPPSPPRRAKPAPLPSPRRAKLDTPSSPRRANLEAHSSPGRNSQLRDGSVDDGGEWTGPLPDGDALSSGHPLSFAGIHKDGGGHKSIRFQERVSDATKKLEGQDEVHTTPTRKQTRLKGSFKVGARPSEGGTASDGDMGSTAASLKWQRSLPDGASVMGGHLRSTGLKRLAPIAVILYRKMNHTTHDVLKQLIKRRLGWFNWRLVYVATFALVLLTCIVSMGVPATRVPEIVHIAPSTNQASRRRYLVRACVHFTRELVIDDGFSWMHTKDLVAALRHYLDELHEADQAIRFGKGKKDVTIGAGFSPSSKHNQVEYAEGCPWREDPSDCSTPLRAGAAAHGLQFLYGTFTHAVEEVLWRYDPTGVGNHGEIDRTFMSQEGGPEGVTLVKSNWSFAERLKLLESDSDVAFILDAVGESGVGSFTHLHNGDLLQGYALILQIFLDDTTALVDEAVLEIRLLYAVYMASVLFGFYMIIFRRTYNNAFAQLAKTKAFVMSMPVYILPKDEALHIVHFFNKDATQKCTLDEEEE